jgi:hypothetical protein
MAGVKTQKEKAKALDNSGASAVSEDIQESVVTEAPKAKVADKKPEAPKYGFRAPFAPRVGKSHVSMPIPKKTKEGIVLGDHQKLTLEDQVYRLEDKIGEDRDLLREYNSVFIKAGFEALHATHDRAMSKKPKGAKHPAQRNKWGVVSDEHLTAGFSGNVGVNVNGENRQFKMERGIIITDEYAVYQAFIAQGMSDLGDVAEDRKVSEEKKSGKGKKK